MNRVVLLLIMMMFAILTVKPCYGSDRKEFLIDGKQITLTGKLSFTSRGFTIKLRELGVLWNLPF